MARAHAGQIVHVGFPGGCVAGIVVEAGRSARVRLLRPSGIRPVGSHDTEGDYRHAADPMTVGTPEGGTRDLPAWHVPQAGCEG
jgi:hypothetical protein